MDIDVIEPRTEQIMENQVRVERRKNGLQHINAPQVPERPPHKDWVLYTTPVPEFVNLIHDLRLGSIDRAISTFQEDARHKSTDRVNLLSKVLATRFIINYDIDDLGKALELMQSMRKDGPNLRESNTTVTFAVPVSVESLQDDDGDYFSNTTRMRTLLLSKRQTTLWDTKR